MALKNSTFKKYNTGLQNIVRGNITDHTFTDAGYTIYYKKCGNFYFGFSGDSGLGFHFIVGQDNFGGSVANIKATFDRFAFKIGVTIASYLPDSPGEGTLCLGNATGSTGTFYTYNGANYVNSGGNSNYVGLGFLAN